MTLAEINSSTREPWFETSTPEPGTFIMYANESDVEVIDTGNVLKVVETPDSIELWEWKAAEPYDGREPDPEDENIAIHSLDKWQLRGCQVLTIK